jgi:hypothetical protein
MTPESEPPHGHPATGHRWLDVSLGVSAMCVSLISLGIAIHHGRTMERMAEANARLVAANSWPFLQYGTGNRSPDNGSDSIDLSISNEGVGPARIETLEIWWHDQPVKSPQALLRACCADAGSAVPTPHFSRSLVAPRILRAGESIRFLTLPRNAESDAVWQRLNTERLSLRLRACYCSVFDECWTSSLVGTHAEAVAHCPVPAVPYASTEHWGAN